MNSAFDLNGDRKTCDWDNPEFRRQYQRDYRAWLKQLGYVRVEMTLSPKVWTLLSEHLEPHSAKTHPGWAVAQWIEGVIQPD
jgi:hypothetical protein